MGRGPADPDCVCGWDVWPDSGLNEAAHATANDSLTTYGVHTLSTQKHEAFYAYSDAEIGACARPPTYIECALPSPRKPLPG